MQSTEERQAFSEFVLGEKRSFYDMGTDEEKKLLVSSEMKKRINDNELAMKKDQPAIEREQHAIERDHLSLLMKYKDSFEKVAKLEGRDKLEITNRIMNLIKRSSPMTSEAEVTAIVTATPVPDPGPSVPTPECPPQIRRSEISIPMIATEMKIEVGDSAGKIGKVMKKLYAERYGQ